MADKNYIRSIRFTEELYKLIDQQEGDNFTQKLDLLVRKCVHDLPQRKRQLKDIQEQITLERKKLEDLRDTRRKIENLTRDLTWWLESANKNVDRLVDALEKTEV